jgi:hypothetical protein
VRPAVATIACLGLLACASTAQAAQRYAAPGGSGPQPCAQAAPCSLKEAIVKAKAGDEVIIGSGSYVVSAALAPEGSPASVYIHGDLGGQMPQIAASGTAVSIVNTAPGARLAYLDMSNKTTGGYGAYCYTGGTIERIRATSVGEGATGIYQTGDCTVRDSVARAEGKSSMAIYASNSAAASLPSTRNVTAIATGTESRGIVASCPICFLPFESETLSLKNAIAGGASADLEAQGASTKILVSNSNYDVAKPVGVAIVDQGANQTAPPLFVDAASGDYREAAGSPTIDAGVADQLGTLDPDGNARVIGSAPDIGAYEFVPPPVPPVPPGQIQSLSLVPARFRVVNAGEAIFSAKKKAKAPIGTTVTYSISAKATTEFFVERKIPGRRVKGKCKPVTKANRARKKCAFFRLNKTGFAHSGATGTNSFKFSGRIGGKGLAPGSYRLVASAGGASKTANFKIVK